MSDDQAGDAGTAVEVHRGVVVEEYRPRILMDPESAKALNEALRANMRAVLQDGTDFGVIPGTGNKPALLKPGAEKLLQWFGFGHAMEKTETERDADGKRLGVTYRCTVTKDLPDGRRAVIGMCEGYAGYDEDRFYTSAGQAEAKERANAERYKRQVNKAKFAEYRAPWNSVIKMCQKRAMVGAALQATSASSLFTQDVEDDAPASQVVADVARAAIGALPEETQQALTRWWQQQGWSAPGRWDAGQWCLALIQCGRLGNGASPDAAAPAAQPAASQEEPPGTDQAWLATAIERAAKFADADEGRAIHAETGERLHAGTCSKLDADTITGILKARYAELATAADTAPVDGTVIPPLDPDDPWSAKVDELASDEDAAAAQDEVRAAVKAGALDLTHGNRILAAISAKAASLPERVAA